MVFDLTDKNIMIIKICYPKHSFVWEEDNIKENLNLNISDFADTPHVGHPDLWMFPPLKVDI